MAARGVILPELSRERAAELAAITNWAEVQGFAERNAHSPEAMTFLIVRVLLNHISPEDILDPFKESSRRSQLVNWVVAIQAQADELNRDPSGIEVPAYVAAIIEATGGALGPMSPLRDWFFRHLSARGIRGIPSTVMPLTLEGDALDVRAGSPPFAERALSLAPGGLEELAVLPAPR